MANFTNDADIYSAFLASSEFGAYPFPSRTPAHEEANIFADDWSVDTQSDYLAGPTSSFRPEANLDSVASVTPYGAQTPGCGQPLFPGQYWPTVDLYAQSDRSGFMSRDHTFANTMASEFSTAVSTPSSAPFNCWGDNQNGSFTSIFHTDMRTSRQPSTGPTRTGMMPGWQSQPYGTPHARSNEYMDAEARASILMPSLIPYPALPTAGPSGGLPETTADAEDDYKITDEDTASTSRRARGTGKTRHWRIRSNKNARRLCAWAKEWKSLRRLPSHEKALGIALEAVSTIRMPVYSEPRLITGKGIRTKEGSKGPDDEHERRKGTRGLNQELSKYYKLPGKRAAWGSPELLVKVLNDVEGLPKP